MGRIFLLTEFEWWLPTHGLARRSTTPFLCDYKKPHKPSVLHSWMDATPSRAPALNPSSAGSRTFANSDRMNTAFHEFYSERKQATNGPFHKATRLFCEIRASHLLDPNCHSGWDATPWQDQVSERKDYKIQTIWIVPLRILAISPCRLM